MLRTQRTWRHEIWQRNTGTCLINEVNYANLFQFRKQYK